jgi:inner membrane protein
MMFFTHLAFGIFLGLLMIKFDFLDINNNFLFLIIMIASSTIPDLDIATSIISKKTRNATYAISYFFKHRGIIHSIFVPIILFIITYTINKDIALAIIIGYSSHIILDSLTKTGTRPFVPITKYKIKGFLKTHSVEDFMILIFLIILIIIIIT